MLNGKYPPTVPPGTTLHKVPDGPFHAIKPEPHSGEYADYRYANTNKYKAGPPMPHLANVPTKRG